MGTDISPDAVAREKIKTKPCKHAPCVYTKDARHVNKFDACVKRTVTHPIFLPLLSSSFNLRVFVTKPWPTMDAKAQPASGTRRRLLPKAVNSKKRPAATKTHTPNLPSEEFPAWARPASGRPLPHPPWAENIVGALREGGLLQEPKSLAVNLWSDCGGMVTEKIAWVDIRLALEKIGYKVDLNLYCACEHDPAAKKIINQNHDPLHYTDDILLDRDLEAGTYMCSKCGVRHEFPKTGIDIYVGSFPCTPWTRRGKRTGFQHDDAQCFIVGLETVFTLKPCVWAFETTEGVDDHRPREDQTNLAKIQQYISAQMDVHGIKYAGEVVRKIHPTWFSYPTQRPRVFGLSSHCCPSANRSRRPSPLQTVGRLSPGSLFGVMGRFRLWQQTVCCIASRPGSVSRHTKSQHSWG